MSDFDRDFWESRWAQAVREHPEAMAARPPDDRLVAIASSLPPGRALDAGCGHGSEALWLAGNGWQVTGVDFSPTALDHARSRAQQLRVAVDWVEGDLGAWTPPAGAFDLVASLYVHVAGPVTEFVERLAGGVAAGGTLLLVGHRPVDPATGQPSPAAGQTQVSVEDAVAALDPSAWQVVLAEEQPRADASSGVDAVIRAVAR